MSGMYFNSNVFNNFLFSFKYCSFSNENSCKDNFIKISDTLLTKEKIVWFFSEIFESSFVFEFLLSNEENDSFDSVRFNFFHVNF